MVEIKKVRGEINLRIIDPKNLDNIITIKKYITYCVAAVLSTLNVSEK